VFGVLPRRTRWSGGGADASGNKEWDDFWIVYRDGPEYEQGRQEWAHEMHDKGGWPAVMISAGAGEPPRTHDDGGGKLEIEKDRWPRRGLVIRQKDAGDLGDSLGEKINKWGYEPEDSLGFCPNFANRSIYFAWRKP
jgi:hypothetical protein